MNPKACTIFIPLFNEEDIVRENTERLLAYMAEKKIPSELILGSNGSTDATSVIIREIALEKMNVRAFHLPQRGPGRAFVHGVQMASSEFIISQDIDLSVNLEFIPLALEFLERCEVVIGCKRMRFQRRSLIRKLGSNFFVFAAATLLGTGVADFSIGAKAYRRSFVLEHGNTLDAGTAYVLELVYYAAQADMRVIELPVECEDRRPSHFDLFAETQHKFAHLFRFAWKQKKNEMPFKK